MSQENGTELQDALKSAQIKLANAQKAEMLARGAFGKVSSDDAEGFSKAFAEYDTAKKDIVKCQKEVDYAQKQIDLENERLEKIKPLDALIDLVKKGKKAGDAEFDEAYKAVSNFLIGAKPAKAPSAGVSRGKISAEIRALAEIAFAKGASGEQVREEARQKGYSGGTSNAVILALERELGLK